MVGTNYDTGVRLMLDLGLDVLRVFLFAGLSFYAVALIIISFLIYTDDPKIAFRQRALSFFFLLIAGTLLIV